MASKSQKIHFNKARLLKIETLNTTSDNNGHKHFVEYSKLKLVIINGQLCFIDPNDYFMPIARISTIKDIIEKGEGNERLSY